MRKIIVALGTVIAGFAAVHAFAQNGTDSLGAAAPQRDLVSKYCVTCHNENKRTAGVLLDRVDVARVNEHPEVWEQVLRVIRAGTMPPPGMPRPNPAAYELLARYLDTSLRDAANAKGQTRASEPRTSALLVVNKSDNMLAFIEAGTGKLIGRVPTGEEPHELVVST